MDLMAINCKSVISTVVLHIINYEVTVHVIRFAFVVIRKKEVFTSLVVTSRVPPGLNTRAGSV